MRGGADLIDIKEPTAGALGKASDDVIRAIVESVGSMRPVSAAHGEWRDHDPRWQITPGLEWVKWGLAGQAGRLAHAFAEIATAAGDRAVLAMYADATKANAPSLSELNELLGNTRVPLVLVDTFEKRPGVSLIDWIDLQSLKSLIGELKSRGTQIALAGSLDRHSIAAIAALQPDWIAVRGAACEGGREGVVIEAKVAELARVIREHSAG